MAKYELRDVNGVLRAWLPAERALRIMQGSDGYFRKWESDKRTATVFEFTGDGVYTIGGVEMLIWTGELLIPCS